MRRVFLVLASSAALACGGSSSSNHGGNGPTGTVGGNGFSTVEARAVSAASSSACSVPNPGGGGSLDIGIRGLKIDLASYANVCGDYAGGTCKLHAGSQAISIILAKLNPIPPYTPPALATGTFTINNSPQIVSAPDANGVLTASYAFALSTGAAPTCAGTPSPVVQGGTLTITQVSDSQVTGSVNLSFSDGSTVHGDFTAPTCPGVSFDVCQIATTGQFCSGAPTCS